MSELPSLGQIRAHRRIAIGGMAEVFEAADEQGRRAVLKVLLPQLRQDPEYLQMFADEAQLTLRLSHPKLVKTLAFAREPEPCIALELVDGCSLKQLLKSGPLSPGVALFIATELLEALDYIHRLKADDGRPLGVIHRDVTPANVLLSRDGAVKLGDFGIAKSRMQRGRTHTGAVKGTVQYLTPEQLTGDEVDARTDLYCVGLVLFEMLTGRPYIDGDSEVALLRAAEAPNWRSPGSVLPHLGSQYDAALTPALARFREQRYRDAMQMHKALVALGPDPGARQVLAAAVCSAASGLVTRSPRAAPAAVDAQAPAGTVVHRAAPTAAPAKARSWWPLLLLSVLVGGGAAVWIGLRNDATVAPAALPADSGLSRAVANKPDAAVADVTVPDVAPDSAPSDTSIADVAPAAVPDLGRKPAVRRVRVVRRAKPKPRRERRKLVTAQQKAEAQRLRARLGAVKTRLRNRGVASRDIPAELKRLFARSRAAIEQFDLSDASSALGKCEALARTVRIDRTLVQRKLRQVDLKLKKMAAGARRERLQKLAAGALDDFLEQRYLRANKRLNRLLSKL